MNYDSVAVLNLYLDKFFCLPKVCTIRSPLYGIIRLSYLVEERGLQEFDVVTGRFFLDKLVPQTHNFLIFEVQFHGRITF